MAVATAINKLQYADPFVALPPRPTSTHYDNKAEAPLPPARGDQNREEEEEEEEEDDEEESSPKTKAFLFAFKDFPSLKPTIMLITTEMLI